MTKQTICINQFLRPKTSITIEGLGDCNICKLDDENKLCKNYYPINIFLPTTVEKKINN